MQESHAARQTEPERTRDASAPRPTQRKEPIQCTSDPQHLSLYAQMLGNRVSPHLRLSASPLIPDEQPAPHLVENEPRQEGLPQGELLALVSGEEPSPMQRKGALRAQLWGHGVPSPLRLSPPSVPVQRKENTTGLPDTLKAGVEDLSGISLDDVHVHYHSSKPAEVQALAYTQSTDIHVGPGQEHHLAHEAWHVVQQKQGRVQPTKQAKGVVLNDDQELEREADVMGEKALQMTPTHQTVTDSSLQLTKRAIGATDESEVQGHIGTPEEIGHLHLFSPSSEVLQRAPLQEIDEEYQTYVRLTNAIKDVVSAQVFNLKNLAPLINELAALAKRVERDNDHEIFKGAYGGISNFVSELIPQLQSLIGDAALQQSPLSAILALMHEASVRVYSGRIDVDRIRKNPQKYIATLGKIDVDGTGLEGVVAQAAYMSGDMFGVAAALRFKSKLGVVIFYDHGKNKDHEIETKLLDFYKLRDGTLHPRVALIPVTDSAKAYKNAIVGNFSPDIFPYGKPKILSSIEKCLSIGNVTRFVADHYKTDKTEARESLEAEWLPEGWKEGKVRGYESDKTIAQWVTEKGFDKKSSYAFIWFRQSGQKGGAHKELDTSGEAIRQIITIAKGGKGAEAVAADKFVIIGDKGHNLGENDIDIDLTEFWNDADSPFKNTGRKMQLALFAYLVHNKYKIMNIGMRSGALEGPALLGVKTVFLEEKYNFQEGRMDQWQGTVPGFQRVELEPLTPTN